METLAADGQTSLDAKPAATSSEGSPQPDETDDAQSTRRQTSDHYADSVNSLLSGRLESHAAAGPGPGSPQRNSTPNRGRTQHRRNDTASSRLPSPGSPATSVIIKESDSPVQPDYKQLVRSELTSRRSLSFSEAALPVIDTGSQGVQSQPHGTPNRAGQPASQSNTGPSPRPSPRQLGRTATSKNGHSDDPLARYFHALGPPAVGSIQQTISVWECRHTSTNSQVLYAHVTALTF